MPCLSYLANSAHKGGPTRLLEDILHRQTFICSPIVEAGCWYLVLVRILPTPFKHLLMIHPQATHGFNESKIAIHFGKDILEIFGNL